ncbi:MAG: peptidase MA family metallohydrolase [Terriglobales bacterium]
MRVPLLLAIVACAVVSPADTIVLKNGRSIVADRVSEKNGRIIYEIGDDSYAIPKSLVDHIDTAPAAPVSAAPPKSGKTPLVPEIPASASIAGTEALTAKIIRDGRVDEDALSALERGGSNERAAAADFVAARHEYERGNRERARAYLERALRFAPENAPVLVQYASVLVQLGRAGDALPYAERATHVAPNSADGWSVLGFAAYSADRMPQAIAAWKRSLELRPDDSIKRLLAKTEREYATESLFNESDSGHFLIRYEGASTSPDLRRQIQSALERDYDDLVRDLGIQPRQNISVSLYTEQAFFDVTEAPSWSGALNDGKLRIPVQGLEGVTPELARVLKHELAHSFINQVSRGRCPQWLHEGIAQLVEPRTLGATRGRHLSRLYQQNAQIPFSALEASFIGFSPFEAVVAYDESLAAAEYIRDTYGISELRSILERIGSGSSTEVALRSTVHSSYADLEDQVTRYLGTKYGK